VIATKTDITRAIDAFYGQRNFLQEAVDDSYSISELEGVSPVAREDERLSLDEVIAKAGEAPVVKLVDLIIRQAIDCPVHPLGSFDHDRMTIEIHVSDDGPSPNAY